MLYAQATFRQGLQSFRKRHHPDFRRQLSTPWTSRARCCRSASFHTGELRPADRCLPRLAVHTYGARIHTHSVCKSPVMRLKSVESSFDEPSGRRFPHKMSWNVGRWMTTEFHTVPRTLMTPVQRRVSTPAHGRRNLRLRLASCPHLVSHARWKKGRKQVFESRNVNQTCFWRKSNFPPGASQLSGRVLTHFNRN